MKVTWAQTNFNSGEWSKLTYGRSDLAKYKNALAQCENFMPTQQGGLTKRPGTRYVAAVKDSTYAPRLQRFEFSVEQAYVLEFGNNYIRFFANHGQVMDLAPAWQSGVIYNTGEEVSYDGSNYLCLATNGSTLGTTFPEVLSFPGWWELIGVAPPYEVATPYSSAEVWELGFAQSADVLYITHPSHPPMKLARQAATTWTLTEIAFSDGPYLPVNASDTTLTPSGTSGAVTVTASSAAGINGGTGFRATDIGRLLRIKCGGVWLWGTITDVTDATHIEWTVAATGVSAAPTTATATASVSGGSVFSCSVTDGGSGYGVTPPSVSFSPVTSDPCVGTVTASAGVITSVAVTYAGSGYSGSQILVFTTSGSGIDAVLYVDVTAGSVTNIVVVHGGTGFVTNDTVTFVGGGSGGSGAVAYASLTDGVVTGITMSVTGTGYGSAPIVTLSAPTAIVPSTTTFWRLGLWNDTDGYPSSVVFHQDRLCFAGATNTPGRVDGSNTGDYENFAPTSSDGQVVDSSAISFTLNSNEVNAIRWMVPDEWGLLIGTAGAEWSVSPSTTQQAITPTNINAKPISTFGSEVAAPLRVGKATLFVQRTGRKLREMIYQFTVNTFQAFDLTLVAEHLTSGGIKQMAVQLTPQQTLWVVCNDGALRGVIYDRDQETLGWHPHVLGGYSDSGQSAAPEVESVACIPAPGATADEVWVVVKRYINGATVRTVEYFAKDWENGDTTPGCVFLDSSAEYNGTATTTISGLTWLVGQTVGVLGDGSTHPDCVVDSSGVITLNRSVTRAQVGLRYTAKGLTLPLEAGGSDGTAQGKIKRVHRVIVRFFQSIGLSLGSNAEGVVAYPEPFRTSVDAMTSPVGLFDGDKRWSYEGTFDTYGQIYWETSDPLPCNITLIVAQLETADSL